MSASAGVRQLLGQPVKLGGMDDRWWWAAGFIAAGLVAGTVAGIVIRRILDRPTRRPAIQQAARPAAAFLFWLFIAAGLIAAVASASPETLEPIPSDLLSWLPRFGVAGLIVIAGFVLAAVAAAGVSKAAFRATGRREPFLESGARLAVIASASVLALTQLGIDTTILDILVAAIAFGTAFALAGIAIMGGQSVARAVAGGKSVAEHLTVGQRLTVGSTSGVLERLTATHAIVVRDDGDTVLIPLSRATETDIVVHGPE